ncbi:MAG: O-antigen ligase family protein [Desulfobacteraceae bacterium]|nr:O-antigen ligase family protein [Desulfobacteraceae bacterium]
MQINTIIVLFILTGGIISIFRPMLLIYLFASLPILTMALSVSEYDTELKIAQLGSLNVFAMDYLLFVLLAVFVLLLLKFVILSHRSSVCLLPGMLNKMILILFAWDIILAALSYWKGFNFQNILRHLSTESLMFLTVLIPNIKSLENKKERFYNLLSLLCVMLVIIALWRYFFSHHVGLTSSGTSRAISGNAIVIFILPICYILFYSTHMTNRLPVPYAIAAFMIIGIILAGHRSGLIVVLMILFVRYMHIKRKKLNYFFIPLWGCALIISILFIFPKINYTAGKSFLGDLALRFNDTFDFNNRTTRDRLDIWQYSVDVLKDRPLLGAGTFPVDAKSMAKNNYFSPKTQIILDMPAHNVFVDKLIHEGIVGFSILVFFFYIIFKQFKLIFLLNRYYASFLITYFCAFFLFSLFNTTFSNYSGRIFFFIMLGMLNTEALKAASAIAAKKAAIKRMFSGNPNASR